MDFWLVWCSFILHTYRRERNSSVLLTSILKMDSRLVMTGFFSPVSRTEPAQDTSFRTRVLSSLFSSSFRSFVRRSFILSSSFHPQTRQNHAVSQFEFTPGVLGVLALCTCLCHCCDPHTRDKVFNSFSLFICHVYRLWKCNGIDLMKKAMMRMLTSLNPHAVVFSLFCMFGGIACQLTLPLFAYVIHVCDIS